ncbi:hypothetical protein Droror1_Dr00000620 [Drosera rotundifolia]
MAVAVIFVDLHAESGLKSLDAHLSGKSYISGDEFTKDDIKVYAAMIGKPGDEFPNAGKWYELVQSSLAARSMSDAPTGGDDDDLDVFGDETEEEKKAAEEREPAKISSSKKKQSGKSFVLLDVKPWDDETDMKKREEAVRRIQMEGLLWGAAKLVPIGYGIKKLQIMMTIVDDLVSVDTIIEERLTAEEGGRESELFNLFAGLDDFWEYVTEVEEGEELVFDWNWRLKRSLRPASKLQGWCVYGLIVDSWFLAAVPDKDWIYSMTLYFTELIFTGSNSFQSPGVRMFDEYIQERLVPKDLDVRKKGKGSCYVFEEQGLEQLSLLVELKKGTVKEKGTIEEL